MKKYDPLSLRFVWSYWFKVKPLTAKRVFAQGWGKYFFTLKWWLTAVYCSFRLQDIHNMLRNGVPCISNNKCWIRKEHWWGVMRSYESWYEAESPVAPLSWLLVYKVTCYSVLFLRCPLSRAPYLYLIVYTTNWWLRAFLRKRPERLAVDPFSQFASTWSCCAQNSTSPRSVLAPRWSLPPVLVKSSDSLVIQGFELTAV